MDQSESGFTVLSLNLHIWQEEDPRACLGTVARFMGEHRVDVAAFQECGQGRDSPLAAESRNCSAGGRGSAIRDDNAALVIAGKIDARTGLRYAWRWDWSHYGFGHWEEGVALMVRADWPILRAESRFLSSDHGREGIESRIGLMADVQAPGFGLLRLASAHLGWPPAQAGQIGALTAWAAEGGEEGAPAATLLCGDWNMDVDTDGYRQVTETGLWLDAYAAVRPDEREAPTCGPQRIDYQFLRSGSAIGPVEARRVFFHKGGPRSDQTRVSDHLGVLVRYAIMEE